MERRHISIKRIILLPVVFGTTLMVTALVIGINQFYHHTIHRNHAASVKNTRELFTIKLDQDAELFSKIIASLTQDEELQNAWLAKDMDLLLSYSSPIYEDLHSDHRVTHFYFHGPDRINALRVHKPSKHGDYIDRFTVAQAAQNQRLVHGIELGPLGTFTLRVVSPWYIDGELTGYIELGEEIEHITKEMKRALGNELVFLINKTFLDRTQWQEGMSMLGKAYNWDQYDDYVIIDSTMDQLPFALGDRIKHHHKNHEERAFEISTNGRCLGCFVPLHDASGAEVGEIVVLNDVTEIAAGGKTLLWFVITISAFILLLLCICYYLYASHIDRRLKKAYADQQRSHIQLESIFQVAPFGMILLDDRLTIKRANNVAAKVVDREASEIINKKCGNGLGCINADKAQGGCGASSFCRQCMLRPSVEAVFRSGQAVEKAQFQHTFLVDGKEVTPWLEVCIEPLSIGEDHYVIVVIGNITERKQAYEAKSRFLANMSHEIRTPMNAVMGFCDILADEELTDDQIGYVNTIRSSGQHLLRVIDDILDFSKIEAGKLDVELIDCSLGDVLAGIESLAIFRAKDNHLEFKINASKDLPARIHTDTARLTQCLINLVNNAIKFTEKGHVYVNVSLEHRDNQPFVRFDIEDTGIGIPPEKQKKIFESFTQADGSHSRIYGGTGLGLAISRQLAELLGGDLALTSEKGNGSVFSLVIPAGVDVANQPRLGSPGIPADTDAHKDRIDQSEFSGRVLVADDVKTNQMLTKLLLKQMGLHVTVVADGNEAVEKALAREFDLILMDIQMPTMNGYEATRALRKEGITTPIIALTANAMQGDDEKCLEAGCDDYLPKPLDRAQLLEKVRKYLPSEAQAMIETADSR